VKDAIMEVMELDQQDFLAMSRRRKLTGYQQLAVNLRLALDDPQGDVMGAVRLIAERIEGKPDQAVQVTQEGGSASDVLTALFMLAESRTMLAEKRISGSVEQAKPLLGQGG
jgi:hypothetical protein